MVNTYQVGAAAATGVATEYMIAKSGANAGMLTAGIIGLAGFFLNPTARGEMVPVSAGAVDGAAAYLAGKYIAPLLKTAYRPSMQRVAAFMPGFGPGRVLSTEI